MQLIELIKDWPCLVKGNIRIDISEICDHHEKVLPNSLFFARQGERENGLQFVEQAIEHGAACIVVEDEHYFDCFKKEVPIIWVPNMLKFMAYAAAAFYQFPSEALTVVAVTGTNGKTTTTTFTYQILTSLHIPTIVIGTNGVKYNGEPLDSIVPNLTTPTPIELQKLFKEAVSKNYRAVLLEASSQGLAQYRLHYTDIDVGVFLNLGEDHIEWHGSIEKYKNAKLRLNELSRKIIVNNDDNFCRAVGCISKKTVFSYSAQPNAHLFYEKLGLSSEPDYLLQCEDQKVVLTFPFKEQFLIENAVAAISIGQVLQLPFKEIISAISDLVPPEGRVQRYIDKKGTVIIIDYAHTAAALQALLSAVKIPRERLKIVFSCGGNRDKYKRKKMGEVASQYCSYIYLTTDNCRNENPTQINQEIASGFPSEQKYTEILNREDAIIQAITDCSNEDVLIIAGKGHEAYQIIGEQIFDFSDIKIVEEVISNQ